MEKSIENLTKISRLIRYWVLLSTTKAGSGHPTSCLSAVELLVGLFFGGSYRYDINNPQDPNNHRFILSKGHAAPLLYAIYAAAGIIGPKQLETLRQFASPLEGHPSKSLSFVEAATGSLGQGLSIGVGLAINAKYLDKLTYKTWVLLGDSEMTEGSNWEAIQLAAHYKLNNLIGIIDVNKFGQRGETMYGHDLKAYQNQISAFGWNTILVNGHNLSSLLKAYKKASKSSDKPTMIIAKTTKGKGISFLEGKKFSHGKALSQTEFKKAIKELGEIDFDATEKISRPKLKTPNIKVKKTSRKISLKKYSLKQPFSTRKAYGISLAQLGYQDQNIICLDAEMKKSTFSEIFEMHHPDRFFEMYIAEQNMVSTALGLSLRGKIPFVSTFAAFLTRAFDQIRMAGYSNANIKFMGSHVGVSIGQDGPSQMGLEDISMFRSIHQSVVLYPSDAVSTEKLVYQAAQHKGIVYLRITRSKVPVIYRNSEKFPIGKSKTLKKSNQDKITLISAGITVHESLSAYKQLKKLGVVVRLIDLYSIKPIDKENLKQAAQETQAILVIEDHHPEGGIAEAVRSALYKQNTIIYSLAVRRKEMSGKPEELLDYEDISSDDIVRKVKLILKTK